MTILGMMPDVTVQLEELPIIDHEGHEYGMAYEAEVDLMFDGDATIVLGVRYLSQSAKGLPYVVRGRELDAYDTWFQKHRLAWLCEQRDEWLNDRPNRIADARIARMREPV